MPVLPGNFDCIRSNASGGLDDLNNFEHIGYGIAPTPNKKTKFERWKIVLFEVPESLLAWLLVEKSETHIVVFFG